MPNQRKKPMPKDQIKGFKQTARELGCDESEKAFDKTLRKLGGKDKKGGKAS